MSTRRRKKNKGVQPVASIQGRQFLKGWGSASAFLFLLAEPMSRITGLKAKKGREKRVDVFLDGEPALVLLAETVLKQGLSVGQELSDGQMEELARTDGQRRCLNAAMRYLAYRPRSEAEVRQRLNKGGFDEGTREKALARLRELGLVDDAGFARFWKENRETFSPRSRRLTALELRRKGLDRETIEQATGGLDDAENAYRAAAGKARRLPPLDYQAFRRRIAAHLGRRGFGYEVISEAVARVWDEYGKVSRK
jgi:regulatory protein